MYLPGHLYFGVVTLPPSYTIATAREATTGSPQPDGTWTGLMGMLFRNVRMSKICRAYALCVLSAFRQRFRLSVLIKAPLGKRLDDTEYKLRDF